MRTVSTPNVRLTTFPRVRTDRRRTFRRLVLGGVGLFEWHRRSQRL